MLAIFPEIAACAASADVERLAVTIRRYFGGDLSAHPRPSLPAIVASAGLQLRRMPMATYGALLGKDEGGSFQVVLVLRDNLEPVAERFILEHLLGHFLYDVQPLIARGEFHVSGFQEIVCPLARYSGLTAPVQGSRAEAQREARADQFAAALLLPPGMLRRAAEKLAQPAKLATFFGVSPACLLRRQQELQMLPSEPVNFLDAEGQLEPPPALYAEAQQLAAKMVPPDAGVGSMPRSFAASTYGATERATRQSPVAAPTGPARPLPRTAATLANTPVGPVKTAPQDSSGDRLRRPDTAVGRSVQDPAAPRLNPAKTALERGVESSGQRSQDSGGQRGQDSGGQRSQERGMESGMERLRQLARKLDKGVPPAG